MPIVAAKNDMTISKNGRPCAKTGAGIAALIQSPMLNWCGIKSAFCRAALSA
jgi:hypothetical protein